MTSPASPPTSPFYAYDFAYRPLATPTPQYDPTSIFCPQGYAEHWATTCLKCTTVKVRAAVKRKHTPSPSPSHECVFSPVTSPSTALTNSTRQEENEEDGIRNFDEYRCLSELFNCMVLPPEGDRNAGEPAAKRTRVSSPIHAADDATPSCSYADSSAAPLTQNALYRHWNTGFLQKLQKELYQVQDTIPKVLIRRIRSIKTSGAPSQEPIIYTTVRNRINHRFDWSKLKKALAYIAVEEGGIVGAKRAKAAIQLMMNLCRQKKSKTSSVIIHGAKLTRWCAAALMAQNIRISQEPTTLLPRNLGFWHFISGNRDEAAARNNLDLLLHSRRALSLLRHRRSVNNTPPNSPQTSSEESDDSIDEIIQEEED